MKTRYPNKKKIEYEGRTYIVEHRIFEGREEFNVWLNGERPTAKEETNVLSLYHDIILSARMAKLDQQSAVIEERLKRMGND